MTLAEILERAAEAADRKDWTRAADMLADAPLSDTVLDRRGWYRSRAKRYDDAIADFEQLRVRRPRDYRPPYMIGFQYYQQEEWSSALPYFDEALTHRPGHIRSLWRRAYALHRLGREREAVVAAGRLLRAWHELGDEQRHEEKHRYAQACHLIGRYQVGHDPAGAADLLREAVKHESGDPYHHYQLAKALRRAARPAEAVDHAKIARRLKPGVTHIELEYAESLIETRCHTEAAEALRRIWPRCRGWDAYRAGTLALRADEPQLAVDPLRRASRDRDTRGEQRVEKALAEALERSGRVDGESSHSATPEPPNTSHRRRRRGRRRPTSLAVDETTPSDPCTTGVVDVVRPDHNFGFLVDSGGTRRHFRIPPDLDVQRGQRVLFTAITAPKGPAARDIRLGP